MVSVRYALVIGAQCVALGQLSFLPRLANEIHEILTDPLLGHCEAALFDVSGPLLNPTVEAMRDHLEEAFLRASEARASLFVAFIGHGRVAVEGPGQVGFDDYYLLPSDCPNPEQPRLRTAWRVGEELRELLRDHPDLDGLVFLIDACQSGQATVEVAARVASIAAAAGARFEVVAATDDRPAADGAVSPSR